MKVIKLASGSINADGSVSIAVTVAPDTEVEAAFLGFSVAIVNGIASEQTALTAIAAEAAALGLTIPGLS